MVSQVHSGSGSRPDPALTAEEIERLQAWLHANVGTPDEPPEVEVISGGASNLTLGVTTGGRRLVVRRPPIGHFLPTAHDMAREHTVYAALRGTGVPVPEALGLCEDETVIGAPFYVMTRVDGVVPHATEVLAGAPEAANARTARDYVDVLARIHALDVDEIGLGGFAKRSGYLERQVGRWVEQWERSKVVDEPNVDALAQRLRDHLPEQAETTLVHGDYRLGNVMLDADRSGRIVAVFDWEMATLGDPLADVGYALLYWGTEDRPEFHPSQGIAELPGFMDGDALVAAYAAASGRDCTLVPFHLTLAAFKLAIIGEGARARAIRNGHPDPFAGRSGNPLVDWALEIEL
jgi:aminoglycoside phosphotransferase (APT) family kinase protein